MVLDSSSVSRTLSLKQLVADALAEIGRLGYSRRSRNRYRATWGHLVEFAVQKQLGDSLSENLISRFLQEFRLGDDELGQGEGWRQHMVWGLRILSDFAREGHLNRTFAEVAMVQLTPAMQQTLRDFQQYCKDRLHVRPTTLERRTQQIKVFLDFLHSQKGRKLEEIRAQDLSEFVSYRNHLLPKSIARNVSDVRSFLRFLTMRGILEQDLAAELPRIRVPKDAAIPSVWDQELIIRLLAAVDRSSPKGKRDYAILLLACRLGLRAGDIRALKLEQIHWDTSTLEITPSKTGRPLVLPLTSEVGEVLIDYLKSGRPASVHREVFLKANPPFDPFAADSNFHQVVSYWRRVAGIRFRTAQKRGMHSLRHTLATRLLQKGTPFPIIAEILGHASLESTRIYAKADVESLRSVALDPEEVNHVH
jgi:site-specific recombinase XerD